MGGVVRWSPVLVPSPGVGVGVRVCLARRLWAVALGSHRRAVLRKGWGGHMSGWHRESARSFFYEKGEILLTPPKRGESAV